MRIISSQNIINPKVLKNIRVILALVIFYTTINRCIYSWNKEIPPLLFFIVQFNLICGLYWLIGSFFSKVRSNRLSFLVTTYISITGIVFALFLDYGFLQQIYTKLAVGEITAIVHYYSMAGSTIAHYIIPFLALVDFLMFTDTRELELNGTVFIYPVCYFIFAITFAIMTGKYIYPFIDPDYVGGWVIVALISIGILCIIFAISKGLYLLNRRVQIKIDKYYDTVLEEK
jgi:hypothetical protein